MVILRQLCKLLVVLCAVLILVPTAALQPELERYPVQVEIASMSQSVNGTPVLRLVGSLGTGCESPVQIEMVRSSSTLEINAYQLMEPGAICPAILVPYESSVYLSPEDMNREITVNGVSVVFVPQSVPQVDENEAALPTLDEFTVEQVELIIGTEGRPILLVSGYKHGGCGDLPTLIEQTVDDGWIQIRLYREISPNIRCSDEEPAFEEQIDLALPASYFADPNAVEIGVVIVINDYIVFLAATEQSGDDMEFQLTAGEREPVTVEHVDVMVIENSGAPNFVVFNVQGILTDGCLNNVGARRVEGEADYNFEVYEILLAGPQAQCLAADRTFSKEIQIVEPEDPGSYSYDFNGSEGTFMVSDAVDGEPTTRIEHVIESVQVTVMESFPEQINLNVSGYIPDGCKAPTQTEINRDGDVFNISIYRELPFGVLCPAIVVDYAAVVSLGAVSVGDYTFIVNGVTATLNP